MVYEQELNHIYIIGKRSYNMRDGRTLFFVRDEQNVNQVLNLQYSHNFTLDGSFDFY